MMLFTANLKNYALLALCASPVFLTGCQILPTTEEAPAPVVQTTHALESHRFALDPQQNLIGTLAALQIEAHDTLPDIARHFGLGHNEIISANPGVDPWLPEAGSRILLPLQFIIPNVPQRGIVLNLANMRMFYFPADGSKNISTYPVGIGRDGWNTPQGITHIISKTKHPVWNVPPSIQKEHALKGDPLPSSVASGPNNPLGDYAMRLALGQYLIHGTNKPYGVGMQMSHGCLNLYPEDISVLFNEAKVGTQVTIVEQPYLVAWQNNMLYLEAHKPLTKAKDFRRPVLARLQELAKQHHLTIDWLKVAQILKQANGIPTPILTNSKSFEELAAEALFMEHPEQLYQQPQPKPLKAEHWSVTAATLADNKTAQRLAALLNHQGPTIPARVINEAQAFHVVTGPFTNQREATKVLKRIRIDFELKGKINPPHTLAIGALSVPTTTAAPKVAAPESEEEAFFAHWFD
jgi:L,D-transpeptidase ErfK/SrfK